jgi:DNA-binding CsgD family transcriptional regulator
LLYRIAHALASEGVLTGERLDATIAALMPHWERSHAINHQIAQAAAVGTVMQNVIDRFGIGLAFVDTEMGLVFANAAFAKAMGATDPTSPEARARMQARLRMMADARFLALVRQGAKEALLVEDGRAVGLYFRPPSLRQTTLQRGGASGVVVIRNVAGADLASTVSDMLQFAYGLTPKEAETALGLIDGQSAEVIAATLGISINTVRTHLKRVYEKVGVQSQTELVARLLRGPVGLLAGELDS